MKTSKYTKTFFIVTYHWDVLYQVNQLDVHIRLSQKESAPYIWTYIWSIFASSMLGAYNV